MLVSFFNPSFTPNSVSISELPPSSPKGMHAPRSVIGSERRIVSSSQMDVLR
jgi:hypothetical protein